VAEEQAITSDTRIEAGVWEMIAGLVLFVATALVVVWQNSQLTVLFDLAYVLENAYRMSLGQVPYRDFPFPYPPLTFLIQAAIIKLGGRVFWHHVVYCALMSGGATVLTWRILLNTLRPMPYAYLVAFILSLPLVVLGIYCVFPHPFYDPDCTFAVLLSLLLIQHFARPDVSLFGRVLVGVSIAVPVFIKQNVGLAFFALTCGALVLLATIESEQPPRRPNKQGGCHSAAAGVASSISKAITMLRCNISPVSIYPQATQERLPRERALRISTIYGFDVSTDPSSQIMPSRPPASSSPTASGQGRGKPVKKANGPLRRSVSGLGRHPLGLSP
jgi:hypothetical protein